MFHYIDQPHTLSFPVELVKSESDLIVRSVENGLGRWTLVVPVISVDAYPFLDFSDLICHLEDTGQVLSDRPVLPDIKETKLASSNQEPSPSEGKNTGIVLVPCHTWKCAPTAISSGVDISEVPGCHLLLQRSSQWGSWKLLQGLVPHELTGYFSVFNLFLLQWIMVTLPKGCKLDNFESHTSLKLSFTNIWGFCLNFAECKTFLESNSPGILALCETGLDGSIYSDNFSLIVYLPLTYSITYVLGLAVYVKQGLPFAQDLYLENPADSYLCFSLALIHSVSYFFFLYQSPSSSLCTVLDSISTNIDEVLSINSSTVFVFGDFNVHHKD